MTFEEFNEKYCGICGTRHCSGIYDVVWREGCKYYDKEFLGYPCSDCDLWHICKVQEFCLPYQEYLSKKYGEKQ